MIRRITERSAHHDWFAVAIDLCIVIAGVFLGMQANNWNEARIDRARARSYHARLVEDLRRTEWLSQASIAYYRDVRTHALATLRGIEHPDSATGVSFVNDAYQATQIFLRSGKHSTYDEILSSGNAELIGSTALRERLANFYSRMDGLTPLTSVAQPYRTRIRSLIPYSVQTRIRAQCDETLSDAGGGLIVARLSQTCNVAILPADVAEAVIAIRSAPGLKQDLTGTLTDLDSKILNFSKVDSAAREMRGILEKTPR